MAPKGDSTFIGKNMVLNALSETKTCDEHPRHDFQIRVPGAPGWKGGGKYMRMHKQGEDETQLKKNRQLLSLRSSSYLCPRVQRRRIVSS